MFSSASRYPLYHTFKTSNLSPYCAITRCQVIETMSQQQFRKFNEVVGHVTCPNQVRGFDYIKDGKLNKGMAFTLQERQALGIHGLLAPRIRTQEEQMKNCLFSLNRYKDDLNKYVYLIELHDRNEKLFYRLVAENIEECLPIVYTPTVGLACQKFGIIYRNPRGLFITINDKGHIFKILNNWPEPDIRAICFTDGERILGLGDLGAYGMGIPVGKLALYTALGGIRPHQLLPIVLDVGTNNEELLKDPMYIGLKRPRASGEEYTNLIDEFMEAAAQKYGPTTLLQFEDFAIQNARRLLLRYENCFCTFNDDIQGTASVALAGIMTALRITNTKLTDSLILFLGAGSAAIGIAELCCSAMILEGITEEEARKKFFLFDLDGLVTDKRKGGVPEHAKNFNCNLPASTNFDECVVNIKPTILIGCSTSAKAFTPSILKNMGQNNKRPIIFALSNPTSKSECTAQEAYDNTEGRCVFASGSPFPPVKYNGKEYLTGQCNNSYIFPGVALGVISSGAHLIPNKTFIVAANTLANMISQEDLDLGRIFPSLKQVREVSVQIAADVCRMMYEDGLSSMFFEIKDYQQHVKSCQYNYNYTNCLPDIFEWPKRDSSGGSK